MEAQTTGNKMHPVLWIAAIAVILLSAAGIGAIFGDLSHYRTPDYHRIRLPGHSGRLLERRNAESHGNRKRGVPAELGDLRRYAV